MNTHRFLTLYYLLLGGLASNGFSAQDDLNHSLHFGAPNSRLVLKDASVLIPWTAEMWVRRHDAPGSSAPLFIGPEAALKLEQFNSDRQVGFTIFGETDLSFDYQAPADEWVHLAFVGDFDGITLFVNGTWTDRQAKTMTLPLNYFGSSPAMPGDQLAAEIDELRVWKTARSEAELSANLSRSLTGAEPGLVGYWRCDSSTDGWTPNAAVVNWVGVGLAQSVTLQPDGASMMPRLLVSQREVSVSENGRASVGVHLDARPGAPIVVRVQRDTGDTNLFVYANALLNFTPDNWLDDQLVTIGAAGDPDAIDGEATFSIQATGALGTTFIAHELDANFAAPVQLAMTRVPALRLEGPEHSLYTVEFSRDGGSPGSWHFLTNLVVSSGSGIMVDWEGASDPQRIYRAALQSFRPPTNMVYLQPGEFTMGSPLNEPDRYDDELAHRVSITRGFWMGRYEVTQDEYYEIAGTRPSFHPGGDLPVEKVSWREAMEYCRQLTARDRQAGRLPRGWAFRLPTEAEWEYACRAGTTTAFGLGPDLRSGMANLNGQHEYTSATGTVDNPSGVWIGHPVPVGSYAPNAWGLYDMHGNVTEWCLDTKTDYPARAVTDPLTSSALDNERIVRGESFYSWPRLARSAARHNLRDFGRLYDVGFRVVLAPADPVTQ